MGGEVVDWAAVTNFGLPGLMLAALVWVAKAWIASNERIQLERVKVEDKKADAMITALNGLGAKVDAHHTLDIQSHAALASGIAELRGQVTEAISWQERTPVENPRQTPAAGGYGPQRPGSRGG